MANHRRTEETFAPSVYSTGVAGYGFDITTDVHAEQQDPTIAGWLDWVWGGYEKEDRAATTSPSQYYVDASGNIVPANTPGGRWVGCDEYAKMHGEVSCTDALVTQRNLERAQSDAFFDRLVGDIAPEPDTGPKKVPWGTVALIVAASALFIIGVQRLPKAEG
jgi:hypothetical protein